MKNTKEPKSLCDRCNGRLNKKQMKAEHADINTKSLLLMFRLNEITIVECPKCHSNRMLL